MQYILSLFRSSDNKNIKSHVILSVRSLDDLHNRKTTKYCPCWRAVTILFYHIYKWSREEIRQPLVPLSKIWMDHGIPKN